MPTPISAMRKALAMFAILGASALWLTACGGGGSSSSGGSSSPSPSGARPMIRVDPDVVACSYTLTLGGVSYSGCEEIVGGSNPDYCEELRALPHNSNVRSVNQCPRSGAQLVCRWELTSGGSRENYYYSGDREVQRAGCELGGGAVVG